MRTFGLLIILSTVFTFLSCEDKKNSETGTVKSILKNRIDSLETKIYESEFDALPDSHLTRLMLESYEKYAQDFSEDTIVAGYLYHAAQLHENIFRNTAMALKLYEKIYQNYPKYYKHGFVLFTMANAYHTAGDTTNAIKNFKLFAEKYPKSDFADDALGMVKLIRMSQAQMDSLFH